MPATRSKSPPLLRRGSRSRYRTRARRSVSASSAAEVARRARTLHNPRMRTSILALCVAALFTSRATPQTPDLGTALRWRTIGPFRAGRGRAVAATPGKPTVFYIGFDNGGVWRSTDYGNNWEPLFDHEATGSIGAIAVAPSAPNVIYVGTGAGIIRPDLATGSGRTFAKVLYKDEYTSANEVRIDPSNPSTVYAALWQQQSTFYEYAAFGPDSTWPGAGGIYKSTDGGTTWTQLTGGLPPVLEANIAIAPSNPQVIYAMVASVNPAGGSGRWASTSPATAARI